MRGIGVQRRVDTQNSIDVHNGAASANTERILQVYIADKISDGHHKSGHVVTSCQSGKAFGLCRYYFSLWVSSPDIVSSS